jgi:carboxypeptidase D
MWSWYKMRSLVTLLLVSAASATLNLKHFHPDLAARAAAARPVAERGHERIEERQSSSIFLNDNTRSTSHPIQPLDWQLTATEFALNGTIPGVNFNVGESYAGLLPIGEANDPNQLYFWFFPSKNPAASKEILIWLTGGVSLPHG